MPPSSSLSMINEDTVLVDRRFAVPTGGPTQSQPSSYGNGPGPANTRANVQEQPSHSLSSKARSSTSTSTSTGTTVTSSQQPQYIFQSSSATMSTPSVGGGRTTPSRSPSPLPSRSPSPDISRLAQTRYARAVQYARYRNTQDTVAHAHSSLSVSSSVMSSTQGSTLSASQPPKVLANTNTIGTTTRPLKPPSHSGSPRVLPPRIKSMSPVPVTPPRPPPSPSRKIPSSPASVTSTSNTTITTAPGNGDNNSFAQSSAEALEWRKHGKRVRAMLLLEDEEKGGSTFQLTNTCSIQRYYRVAERVLEKFLSTSIRNNVNELELAESYLVGNRLVKFLSIVLPTHDQYCSKDPTLQVLRKRSQEQLVQLLRYLEEIALVMDELQYNNYILRDLTPEERALVQGLTTNANSGAGGAGNVAGGSGGKTTNGPTTNMDVSMDSTRSSMSVQSAMASPARATPSPSPISPSRGARMDRTRSTFTHDSSPSNSTKPWFVSNDSLQERVAQVIQMTESFSETYESTMASKSGGAPQLALKRSLMAAAAAGGEESSTSTTSRRYFTPHAHPSMRNTKSKALKQHRTTSPTFSESSDPSLQTLSSVESEANPPIDRQHGQQQQQQQQQQQIGSQDNGWDFGGGEFVADWDGNEFQSGGGNNKNNPWNHDTTTNNNNINNNAVPKLKQPKSHPTLSERARAAAAMQYDQLFTQSQPAFKYSNGTNATSQNQTIHDNHNNNNDTIPLPSTSDGGISPHIKTKIEDRLERASIVQRELRHHELRKRRTNSTSQRWRTTRKSEDRTPLKAMPLQDFGDVDDNSLLQDKPPEAMTNQSILRHFRGCVQCMLD